jgi:hypothetical protein
MPTIPVRGDMLEDEQDLAQAAELDAEIREACAEQAIAAVKELDRKLLGPLDLGEKLLRMVDDAFPRMEIPR